MWITCGRATPSDFCADVADPIAWASGPGSITIPGPPPYGRSSTVRCASVAKSRGFHVRSAHNPRSCARPVTPTLAACCTISGNSVTTSILTVAPLRIVLLPVDLDASCVEVHRIHVRVDVGDEARPLAVLDAQDG